MKTKTNKTHWQHWEQSSVLCLFLSSYCVLCSQCCQSVFFCLHTVCYVLNVASGFFLLLSSYCVLCSQCCQCVLFVFVFILCAMFSMLPVCFVFFLHTVCYVLNVASVFCVFFYTVWRQTQTKPTGNIENITHSMETKKTDWQHWEHNTQYEDKNEQNRLATLRT
jgi:hypothetical protein